MSTDARPCGADARDCVFFMHGVLDTSMGWVSNGITGSQAFAAYDQGFDVWLGNSRANPPRDHIGARESVSAALWNRRHHPVLSITCRLHSSKPSIWPIQRLWM